MKNPNPFPSKTFCILPWIHAATYTDGSVILCCVARNSGQLNLNRMSWPDVWNSQHFREARLSMLEGSRFHACTSCWSEEQSGVRSHRQTENDLWLKTLGPDRINELIFKTKSDGTLEEDLITVDFRLGNTCNLQCVMCRPQDSSKWYNTAKRLAKELQGDVKHDWIGKSSISIDDFDWYKNPEFWESFYQSCGNMRHIILAGGEPLLIKEHMELIRQLVKRGYSQNIEIRYHTNGTVLDDEMIQLWQQFKRVDVMVSLDGAKELNDFIRWPADWSVIENNLRRYDEETSDNVTVKLLCTVQALNIGYLPEFADWVLSQNYRKISKDGHNGLFHTGSLHWPQYLCAKVLPWPVKERIAKKIMAYADAHKDNGQIQGFRAMVNFMISEDWNDKFAQTKEYISKIEEIRGIEYPYRDEIFGEQGP